MRNIFTGLILVILNFYITSGNGSLNLLPDFIGYAFVLKGVLELARYNLNMLKFKGALYGLIGISIFDFIIDFIGLGTDGEIIGYGIESVSLILHFYVLYRIIEGIKEIQCRLNFDLFADNLMVWWKVNVILSGISFAGGFFIPLIQLGVSLVAILFVIQIYKSCKQWDRYCQNVINIER